VIRAAGCVVVRDGRVLLIHRERYDDWSLPKGKLEPGESWEDAAVREVEEETGIRGELGEYLGETAYGDKVVRWWLMTSGDDAAPSNEVDAVAWATPDEALALLSYARDRELVSRLR
jgi:8-oxo-dGTP diphosphatase